MWTVGRMRSIAFCPARSSGKGIAGIGSERVALGSQQFLPSTKRCHVRPPMSWRACSALTGRSLFGDPNLSPGGGSVTDRTGSNLAPLFVFK